MQITRPNGKKYYPVIGLEIHAELKTNSKMFCSCKNDPDEVVPNKNVCSICLGHPGTLPTLNKQAIKHVLKVGHAIGANIADFTEWDRKNYFYPDIPKGYQISQYAYPLITGGSVEVKGASKDIDPESNKICLQKVQITRIHLEEDTASSTHDAPKDIEGNSYSLVNFNRAGVPLMELVTEPVIHDAKTASNFAKELQLLLRSLGAGEANMEKGEMRVEANISVSEDPRAHQSPEQGPLDFKTFGRKVEVKNLNSFRSVEKAIEFEIDRHIDILERRRAEILAGRLSEDADTEQETLKSLGLVIVQETRGFDETTGKTFSQREKEDSHDYRYFPDPDLPKLMVSEISDFAPEALKRELGELPWDLRAKYIGDFDMKDDDAEMFVQDEKFRQFFHDVANRLKDKEKIKLAINYITSDIAGFVKKFSATSSTKDSNSIQISTDIFADTIEMVVKGEITSRGAKDIIAMFWQSDDARITDPAPDSDARSQPTGSLKEKTARQIAEESGFIIKNDPEALQKMIEEIIIANPKVVADYRAGKEASLMFFVGQIMKLTKGSVNPQTAKEKIIEVLKK